ncbi:uncharacterized protein ACA1_133400 [Acanthamoeba castellanii str. Neff]|uniref:Choice-of-anchor A domain-containing protein n=1 Tax=Acanthamoeba castellanii (strain ATCC 30010 / Neff) TaxID=1257118 RepID=L8H3L4_ACACF|nr:uncharacterized protein ACA1_133400 [Acanthamoeba castellanii str. Neff]ELR19827.1 hypothetical protein ACA1_133400 [Acanthamoeba castellanii str. Neff]
MTKQSESPSPPMSTIGLACAVAVRVGISIALGVGLTDALRVGLSLSVALSPGVSFAFAFAFGLGSGVAFRLTVSVFPGQALALAHAHDDVPAQALAVALAEAHHQVPAQALHLRVCLPFGLALELAQEVWMPVFRSRGFAVAFDLVAADFSAFVLGNSSAVGPSLDMVNGDFESAAAVRGGLRLRSFGVNQAVSGSACTDGESQRFTLIAEGGTIDYSNGQLFCGNLLASADAEILSAPSFGGGSVKVGDVTELSGIDFEEAGRELLDESETLCSAVEDGEATDAEVDSSGGITLTATGATVEMFSVRARDLSAATGVRFVGFEGQSINEVIINVMREADDSEASLVLSNFAVDLGSVPVRSVLWNICGGTDLVVIQAVGLPERLTFVLYRPTMAGALLAAGADVTLQNGQVTGQVVARTMRGSGGGQIINPAC